MFEFALPDLGEGVAEGEILEWHVAAGDAVAEDDVLLEVETDKAAVEVPSPVAGTVAEVHGDPGDVVETGATVVTIDTDGEVEDPDSEPTPVEGQERPDAPAGGDEAEQQTATASTGDGQRVFAPPSVRRLARELGVNVAGVAGSGPGGRVTEGDVRQAAEGTEAEDGEAEERKAEETGVADTESEGTEGDGEASAAETDGLKSAVRRVGEGDSAGGTATGTEAESTAGTAAEADGETDPGAEAAVKSAVKSTASTASRERTLATPATRRLARELGVDVDAVPTDVTRDGEPFVDEAAVRSYAEREEGAGAPSRPSTAGGAAAATDDLDVSVARTEAYRGIRRRIGERMARSRREVPHATHHDRVEVSELVAARERLEPLAEDRGVDLTYTPFILKCVGAALQDHPVLNTRLDTDAEAIHYLDSYHVGVATDTDRGLLVPVVRDVDQRGIMALATATNDIVERARDGSIDRTAMEGGTFTVTNVGAIGGEYADPVINVPQTAVLAVGSLRERPVAVDGTVETRPTLPLSLAIDHRVIDGADAARFTNTLKSYLADPTRLLLE